MDDPKRATVEDAALGSIDHEIDGVEHPVPAADEHGGATTRLLDIYRRLHETTEMEPGSTDDD